MKRVFGITEAVFDILYLLAALILGIFLLTAGKILMGCMTLILAFGDSFHLVPRIAVIFSGREEALRPALGRGKQITSITMTVFYLLLWLLAESLAAPAGALLSGAFYALAALRIFLCLLPQNRWADRYPPVKWGILRNVPFFLMGAEAAVWLFLQRGQLGALSFAWLAVALSFLFYLPVVLWSNRNPKVGMLMLPKTLMYLWLIVMCVRY